MRGLDMTESVFTFFALVVVLYVILWIYILLPAGMATKRGRSAFGWVVLSLLFSPVLACLLLLLLGDNPNAPRG